jgi:hypothetical protein
MTMMMVPEVPPAVYVPPHRVPVIVPTNEPAGMMALPVKEPDTAVPPVDVMITVPSVGLIQVPTKPPPPPPPPSSETVKEVVVKGVEALFTKTLTDHCPTAFVPLGITPGQKK